MKYNIELSGEYVEKLYALVGYSDSEIDDELEIEDAIKQLIDESVWGGIMNEKQFTTEKEIEEKVDRIIERDLNNGNIKIEYFESKE